MLNIEKIIRIINFYFFKIRFFNIKNIKLPTRIQIPLNSKIELSKTVKKVNIKRIVMSNNVYIKIRDNAIFSIGEGCSFNNGCIITCRKSINIGDNVIFGPNVMIFDHDHNYMAEDFKGNFICDDITIEDNCWIGANCIILKGAHIKKNSIIAAGSIVNGVVNENVVYYNKIEKVERKYQKEDNI